MAVCFHVVHSGSASRTRALGASATDILMPGIPAPPQTLSGAAAATEPAPTPDQGTSGGPVRRTRVTGALICAGLIMAAAGFAAAGMAAWDSRQRAFAEAEREIQNLSFVLADHTERTIQAVELSIASALERGRLEGALAGSEVFTAWARSEAVHAALAERIGALQQADALLLIDVNGSLLASSRFFPPPPRDLSDRAYFRAALDNPNGRAIGPPVLNRGTDTWAFHFAQRIDSPAGEFLGIAVAVLEVAHFVHVYDALALGPASNVSLFRSDGVLLARHPDVGHRLGEDFGGSEQFQRALANSDGRPIRLTSPVDGQDRLISARALPAFPLQVHVGVAIEAVFAGWRKIAFKLAVGAFVLASVVAGAVVLAARTARAEAAISLTAQRRERELAAAREAHQRELAEQHADFRVVVESMSPAVWRFGPGGRLALSNGRGVDMLGLPPGSEHVGVTPNEIARAAAAAGAIGAATAVDRLVVLAAAGEAASFTQDLGTGRAVLVALRPLPDGGWMTTFEDVSEQRASEARARHSAAHDPLTGLANRRHLDEALGAITSARDGTRTALLSLDLDRFKQINDALGHPVGDGLLKAAAERIVTNVRTTRNDGGTTRDLVARPGGDEFAVVLTGLSGDTDAVRATATSVATRLVTVLSEPFLLATHQALVGASVGVALFPDDGSTPDELVRAADLALYRAKIEGRGRHRFFEHRMARAACVRQLLEVDLRRALLDEDGAGFEVHFQPIVDVATRTSRGAEALVRWRRPGSVRLSNPSEFVPVAEETGLMVPLGDLVLRQACKTAAAWRDRSLRVAVNLSPTQVHADGLVAVVEGALAEAGLDPRRLELEVTEGVLLQGTPEALATMHRLRTMGVRFSMDDFGTGYSSLSYLRTFPFDQLKIDRSFVHDIQMQSPDAAIVRTIVGLCTELGIATVAEGVETEEQLALIAAAGCHEAQGYLFGRPVPADELWRADVRFLRRNLVAQPAGRQPGQPYTST